ncbi:MAG: hypothetical protein M3540_03940 [Actinomycetota bacterium]|nr:hypothetical protein [Actinomycetota bacterium]
MKPVIVTPHAVEQFQRRFHDTRASGDVRQEIEDEVRLAIAEGRIQDHKTAGFGLYGRKPRGGTRLLGMQRFVWSEDQQRAWIVDRQPHETVVITTLSRTQVAV